MPDVSAGRPEHLLLGQGPLGRLALGWSRLRFVPAKCHIGLRVVQTHVKSFGLYLHELEVIALGGPAELLVSEAPSFCQVLAL